MKHRRIFTSFALCAALLLSGCNADKPAVTSPVTEEVTKTATASDNSFDKAFWRNINSKIIYADGKYYYISYGLYCARRARI